MATSAAVQQILQQIAALPLAEQQQLQAELATKLHRNGTAQARKPTRDRVVAPLPTKNQAAALRWLAQNARAYVGQWVALDGERLIAHGLDAQAVYAAAKADGAYLPLIELVNNPDAPPFAGF